MTDLRTYQQQREDRLATLLEDPASWLFIARHADEVRQAHPYGSPAYSALTRLHNVALDLIGLTAEPQPETTPTATTIALRRAQIVASRKEPA